MTTIVSWLPADARRVLARLEEGGASLCLVGGSVLDFLLGRPPGILDFVAEGLSGNELKELGGVAIGGPVDTHIFRYRKGELEITPIARGALSEDLKRRDFTIHAMAVSYPHGKIVDLRGGRAHLEARILVAHDQGRNPFLEDPVRIFRGLRRLAEGFRFHPRTLALIAPALPLLKEIPPERIGREIEKLLLLPRAPQVLRMLKEWPELLKALDPLFFEMAKAPPPPGHLWDPWTHSTYVLEQLPPLLSLRFTALLHDTGKVLPPGGDEEHAKRSAAFARTILSRWALPRSLRKRIELLVLHHSFPASVLLQNRALLREFIALHEEYLFELLRFRRADRYGAGTAKGYRDLEELERVIFSLSKEEFPRKPSKLPVDREGILRMYALPPSQRREFLVALWRWVLEDPAKRNTPSAIMEKAKELAPRFHQG